MLGETTLSRSHLGMTRRGRRGCCAPSSLRHRFFLEPELDSEEEDEDEEGARVWQTCCSK